MPATLSLADEGPSINELVNVCVTTKRHLQVCYSESGLAICYLLQLVPTGFGRESSEKSNLGCFQTCKKAVFR